MKTRVVSSHIVEFWKVAAVSDLIGGQEVLRIPEETQNASIGDSLEV